MRTSRLAVSIAMTIQLTVIGAAGATPFAHGLILPGPVELTAGGCGPGAWRGPWGHCRNTPFYGRMPGGRMKCPPGSWVGPYGHCRNTPFHGRWPDGSFH